MGNVAKRFTISNIYKKTGVFTTLVWFSNRVASRTIWLNCALQGDEVLYWVSTVQSLLVLSQYNKVIMVNSWWHSLRMKEKHEPELTLTPSPWAFDPQRTAKSSIPKTNKKKVEFEINGKATITPLVAHNIIKQNIFSVSFCPVPIFKNTQASANQN